MEPEERDVFLISVLSWFHVAPEFAYNASKVEPSGRLLLGPPRARFVAENWENYWSNPLRVFVSEGLKTPLKVGWMAHRSEWSEEVIQPRFESLSFIWPLATLFFRRVWAWFGLGLQRPEDLSSSTCLGWAKPQRNTSFSGALALLAKTNNFEVFIRFLGGVRSWYFIVVSPFGLHFGSMQPLPYQGIPFFYLKVFLFWEVSVLRATSPYLTFAFLFVLLFFHLGGISFQSFRVCVPTHLTLPVLVFLALFWRV